MMTTTVVKSVCTLASVALLATACATTHGRPMSGGEGRMAAASATPAASLRVALNGLLGEHVILAAAATGAALDGRDAEFKAAAGALDANSVDLAKAIGSVYGKDAEQAFLPLWRRHIGFVVDYTVGVATKDRAKQQKAVSDLIGVHGGLRSLPQSAANPNLPKTVVADLVKHHVVDPEGGRRRAGSEGLRARLRGPAHGGGPHADDRRPAGGGDRQAVPRQVRGQSDAPAAGLRTVLNLGLREHAYLAGAATSAALGGRDAEFKAAAGALDANSVDLAKAIGSVYGKDAEQGFLPLWRRHIGFFVDYTWVWRRRTGRSRTRPSAS